MAKIPMWLEKDGKVELQADSEAAKADGWEEPTNNRSNGEPWNPPSQGGEMTQAEALVRAQETSKPKPKQ